MLVKKMIRLTVLPEDLDQGLYHGLSSVVCPLDRAAKRRNSHAAVGSRLNDGEGNYYKFGEAGRDFIRRWDLYVQSQGEPPKAGTFVARLQPWDA